MRFPATSAVGQRHMNKQPGVGEFFPCQGLEWYVPITWLNTLQRDGVLPCGRKDNISQECEFCTWSVTFLALTYELIPNEVVIQNHEANHGELGQVDLELKALIKDGVVPILGHCPSAALCAVDWNTVYFHIHIGVHNIAFGPRTPGLRQVLATYNLGVGSVKRFDFRELLDDRCKPRWLQVLLAGKL